MRIVPPAEIVCTWLLSLPLLLLSGCGQNPHVVEAKPPAQVKALPARLDNVAVEVPTIGTVVPIETSRVASGAAGLVIDFPFRIGSLVKEGDLLAELRSVTLAIELEGARALLREREQRYTQLQAGYRAEEIEQAHARMRAAEAASKFAEANERRVQDLYDKGVNAVSDQEVERAVFEAEEARQLLAEARSNYEMMVKGYRTEEIEAARAAYEAQQQEVKRLEDEMEKRRIRAPFTGYLVEKHTDLGEWVELGGQVATLVKLDEVEVQVNVEESHVHQITVGEKVDVSIDALGRQVSGTIFRIVPRADWRQGSRSFPVIVRIANSFENDQPLLREGMVARIRFRGQPRQAILAHKDSILRTPNATLVYVVGADNTVRAVEIEEGISSGEYIEIRGNVQPGDLLVTEGVERLRPFDVVAVQDLPTGEAEQTADKNSPKTAMGGM